MLMSRMIFFFYKIFFFLYNAQNIFILFQDIIKLLIYLYIKILHRLKIILIL